ncbi:MAG: hypothetical protein PHQ66_02030 [Candidatus Nanoarchaeia archaeon]|nr:hypothetical protein [Candidatus Nanoarchaeia archaeon]MDD5357849.1 hypothetical protein [Candidatus Nanoarchaeia archaeon]MDD5588768.1 hypothetical protein [Candidatus Nanoarchaeia archaeon]
MRKPKQGEVYEHFKGKDRFYEIITVVGEIVWYKSLYEDKERKISVGEVFKRPLDEFCGYKEFDENYTNYDGKEFQKGEKVKRFVLIKNLENKING